MTQLSFDEAAGQTLKAEGLDRVEATHPDFVPIMRAIAKRLGQSPTGVHIDDLRQAAATMGQKPRHPNAWGVILRGPGWMKTGARPSRFPSNHGHVSPIWKWVGPCP